MLIVMYLCNYGNGDNGVRGILALYELHLEFIGPCSFFLQTKSLRRRCYA